MSASQPARSLSSALTSSSHLFSLNRCRAPPALPSFPTRRSSDLGAVDQADGRLEDRDAGPLGPGEGAGDVKAIFGEELDRKSTRLNSSHVAISYAVFCLKKKKLTQQGRH